MSAIDHRAGAAYPPPFPARGYDFVHYVPARNWVGGVWRDGSAGTEPVVNPRHGKAMGEVSLSSAEETARAVDAARAAFPGWRDTPVKERVQVLYRLKHCMERDLEELIWAMITRSDPATSIDIITNAWSTHLDPRISPEDKAKGNLTNSRAIIDACRPYHWKDEFPMVNAPTPELARESREKWGYLCD